MKIFRKVTKAVGGLALSSLLLSPLAVLANDIGSASVSNLISATFDNGGANFPAGGFFADTSGVVTPAVTITDVGTSNGGETAFGTGIVEYDGTTLILTSVLLPDMDLDISGVAFVDVSGATISLTTPDVDADGGLSGFQVDGGLSVVADFSTFTDVVTACDDTLAGGTICPLLSILTLDGVKYQIDGTITAGGGDTLTLTVETSNTSQYTVEIITLPAVNRFATNIESASVTGLISATFDNGGANFPAGGFFADTSGVVTPAVTITDVGTKNGGITEKGTGIVKYDGTTLTLTSILLPDMDLAISGVAFIETSGATLSLTSPSLDSDGGLAGFQVDGGVNVVADFSTFTDVVTSCEDSAAGGTICPLLSILTLDGVKFQIDGTLTPAGGDVLTLMVETSNTSQYTVEITTVVVVEENVPVPAIFIVVIGILLASIGYVRNRVRKVQ